MGAARIVATDTDEASVLISLTVRQLTAGQARKLAAKLAEIAPGRLEKSFFTNSGTEAVELVEMELK